MRKIIPLTLLFIAIALPAFAEQKWDPIADPKAVVIEGSARFTMLMPRALDPVAAGKAMPLPQPRPKSAPKGEPEPQMAQPQATQPLAEPAPVPRPRPKS